MQAPGTTTATTGAGAGTGQQDAFDKVCIYPLHTVLPTFISFSLKGVDTGLKKFGHGQNASTTEKIRWVLPLTFPKSILIFISFQ